MKIYLIRHGESQGNEDHTIHRDIADHAIPLTEKGIKQALITGKWLEEEIDLYEKFTRVWHSPYLRTVETKNCLLYKNPYSETMDPNVREHMLLAEQQFGLFDGLSSDEIRKQFPAEYAFYQKQRLFKGKKTWARFPLGESRFDVCLRVHQAFGTFHRDHEKHGVENLVIVAHGTTIRCFVKMWCHYPWTWLEECKNPSNCSVWKIDDSKDCGIVFDPGV